MRTSNTLLFLIVLAWVCQGGEAVGVQDCDHYMDECYGRFQASAHSDQCSAYFELMACVQGVRDEKDCNNVQVRFEDDLRVIMDWYAYCAKPGSSNRGAGVAASSTKIFIVVVFLVALLCRLE